MPGDLIEKMSLLPNRILGLDGGTLTVGKNADITIIDPDAPWVVDPRCFYSKSRNTAFEGMALTGFACATVLGGQVVYERERK